MIVDWQHHFLAPEIYASDRSYPGNKTYQEGKTKVHFQNGKPTVHLPEEIMVIHSHFQALFL